MEMEAGADRGHGYDVVGVLGGRSVAPRRGGFAGRPRDRRSEPRWPSRSAGDLRTRTSRSRSSAVVCSPHRSPSAGRRSRRIHFVVDYDGDGNSDLVFIGVGPQVYVMRGDGAGSLKPPELLSIGGHAAPDIHGRPPTGRRRGLRPRRQDRSRSPTSRTASSGLTLGR